MYNTNRKIYVLPSVTTILYFSLIFVYSVLLEMIWGNIKIHSVKKCISERSE